MGKNNNRWGKIREVEINEISPVNPSQYYELYEELCLRLEQTPPKLALRLDFDDGDAAKNTRRSLQRHFDMRKGAGAVVCCQRIAQMWLPENQRFLIWRMKNGQCNAYLLY